ncbi:hypothetical protein G3I19_35375 [Streptomyces sp. SID10853]|nr:hypothetical protein [Streptomyces sp. SID10853]NDZ83701.1 hypothetical protein [Streptomyces sp. SID10853]
MVNRLLLRAVLFGYWGTVHVLSRTSRRDRRRGPVPARRTAPVPEG